MKQNIATIISRIFDPFVSLGLAVFLVLQRSPVFIPAFSVTVLLPFFLFLVAWKTKFVSNWDVSNRRERPKILWLLVAVEATALITFRAWELVPIFAVLVGFAIITNFWKMSGHAVAAAIAAWYWWPVLFAVPLVCWARVQSKNHTTMQVIAGSVYSWSLLFLFERILNVKF